MMRRSLDLIGGIVVFIITLTQPRCSNCVQRRIPRKEEIRMGWKTPRAYTLVGIRLLFAEMWKVRAWGRGKGGSAHKLKWEVLSIRATPSALQASSTHL
jgi:hypothetical protein